MRLEQRPFHLAVLRRESVEALRIAPGGVYADLTLGGGGHARAILEALGPDGRLLCFDQDAEALRHAPDDRRVVPIRGNFRHLRHWLDYYGVASLDGVLADLGVSSHHFDTCERGFTFREDGPLDMRMSQSGSLTAASILQRYEPARLADLFGRYGEVARPHLLAEAIASHRAGHPLRTTGQLRRLVLAVYPHERQEHKLLARVFQALRIEVNGELAALGQLLGQLEASVGVGGRVAIISYHSLEDRMVKEFFRHRKPSETHQALLYGGGHAPFRPVGSKGIVPRAAEVSANPRARSARLRVGERQ